MTLKKSYRRVYTHFNFRDDVVKCPYCSESQSVSLKLGQYKPLTYICRKCKEEVSYAASAKEVFND